MNASSPPLDSHGTVYFLVEWAGRADYLKAGALEVVKRIPQLTAGPWRKLGLSEPQFPHLQPGGNNSIYLTGLW